MWDRPADWRPFSHHRDTDHTTSMWPQTGDRRPRRSRDATGLRTGAGIILRAGFPARGKPAPPIAQPASAFLRGPPHGDHSLRTAPERPPQTKSTKPGAAVGQGPPPSPLPGRSWGTKTSRQAGPTIKRLTTGGQATRGQTTRATDPQGTGERDDWRKGAGPGKAGHSVVARRRRRVSGLRSPVLCLTCCGQAGATRACRHHAFRLVTPAVPSLWSNVPCVARSPLWLPGWSVVDF